MNKTMSVLRHELSIALRSASFVITAFILPLIGVAIFAGVSIINQRAAAGNGPGSEEEAAELRVEGFVDASGLIEQISSTVPEGILIRYPDEARARAALDGGAIAAYYVLPADYLESGNLEYVNPDYRFGPGDKQSWVMENTIFDNLLGNDPGRIDRGRNRVANVEWITLTPDRGRDEDNPLTFFVPYGTMMIFYMVILLSASLLLNSVNQEKRNRVMEILLVSVTPRQLLTGKIVGLGVLGLIQAVIWFGTGYGLLALSGRTFAVPPGFQLPPSILLWGLVFFLLGYAVYASLMAGLGALVPNLKEASQSTILVIFPLLIPLFLIGVLIENPHGLVSIVLSVFPLTAPVAMMARLSAGGVPVWQPAVAAVLLALTAVFIVRSVANMFRAQNLLSGQPLSITRFYRALFGRA